MKVRISASIPLAKAGFLPLRGRGGGARWMPAATDPHDESQSKAASSDQTFCLKISCYLLR
jgi:hypothetical protein